MSFSHHDFYGRGWERAVEFVEERMRRGQEQMPAEDPEAELPEAEIGDDERRAAMARERARRLNRR